MGPMEIGHAETIALGLGALCAIAAAAAAGVLWSLGILFNRRN